MKSSNTILFAAGGTGGHVIPAMVLAKKLKTENPELACVFVGAKGRFEQDWVPKQGFTVELLDMGGLKSGSLLNRIMNVFKIPVAFWKSYRILQKYKPQRLFGIGGYTSGPIMLIASIQKIPCAILEPNAHAGFSNQILARFVHRVYIVFDQASQFFPKKKIKNFGHLLRDEIFQIKQPTFQSKKKTVTILGGSQGSVLINQTVCDLLEKYPDFQNIKIIHQTGQRDFENIQKRYQKVAVEHRVAPFFDNMNDIYASTDLIVARSGSSVIEFASIGIPSILIPLSIAADQHQLKNAQYIEQTGGAKILLEKDLSAETLYKAIKEMLAIDLSSVSNDLRKLRKASASKDIMEDFLSLR